MSSFTYIISSADDLTNPARAWDCYVTLGGLPQGVKYFRCRVLNFSFNPPSFDTAFNTDTHVLYLTSDNFILDGARSGNKSLNMIACATNKYAMMTHTGSVFKIANFNGKTINFRFVNDYGISMQYVGNMNSYNTAWNLILELTPIDDCCC